MSFPSFLFLNSSEHPSGSRLFWFFIPPVRRSRAREVLIILEHLLCSFEPDPLSGKPDPENLRYQAVSKQNNNNQHGFASASVAHGVGNKDVEKDQGGGTEGQSTF